MPEEPLSLACRRYDRTDALLDGRVKVDGLTIRYVEVNNPHDTFVRMIRDREFDFSEFSFSNYLTTKSQQGGFTAIPVFPSRLFRHSYIYVNSNSGIREPRDLIGRKVGAYTSYHVTALLWMRGMLQHEYDVAPHQMLWYPQTEERMPLKLPPEIRINKVPEGTTVDGLLAEGKLDAIMAARILPSIENRDPRVRRLFEDPKQTEMDYFRKTGIFPIMHTVVMKDEIYREIPWSARNLLDAFQKAKLLCYERRSDPNPDLYTMVWHRLDLEKEIATMGPDPWPYNIRDNRVTLDAMLQYAEEQHLVSRSLKIDELFAPETLD